MNNTAILTGHSVLSVGRTTSTAGRARSCRWQKLQPFYNWLTTLPIEDGVAAAGFCRRGQPRKRRRQ